MLTTLSIRNLAIIDAVTLPLSAGFTVLTGETGAGKSILIDALGLLTGGRADTQLVRDGCDRAEIVGEFDLANESGIQAWLTERDWLDADDRDQLIVRRIVLAEGKTRAFINGHVTPLAALRELGESLIQIFGQSESLTLLRPEVQRTLLDDYADHADLLAEVAASAAQVQATQARLEALRARQSRDPSQLDLLRYQVQELAALGLTADELRQLDTEHRRHANASRLIEDGIAALNLLSSDDDAAESRLGAARALLEPLAALDPDFEAAAQGVAAAQAQAQEAVDHLRRTLDRIEVDPPALQRLERRLEVIHDLARKHRVKPAELVERERALSAELASIEGASEALATLEASLRAETLVYRTAAATLSKSRSAAASRLAQAVTEAVQPMGMAHAQLSVAVNVDDGLPVRAHGTDEVRFDFSANPGQALRPLAKVASGGELSRVSLALQVVALQCRSVGTMIFDEVDAGISGAVSEQVGRQLRALGNQRQVLCVTHLAQVAAQGVHHFAIRKTVENGATFTRVAALSEAQRIDELARLQGGIAIGASAREHAADLLRRAQAPAARPAPRG